MSLKKNIYFKIFFFLIFFWTPGECHICKYMYLVLYGNAVCNTVLEQLTQVSQSPTDLTGGRCVSRLCLVLINVVLISHCINHPKGVTMAPRKVLKNDRVMCNNVQSYTSAY